MSRRMYKKKVLALLLMLFLFGVVSVRAENKSDGGWMRYTSNNSGAGQMQSQTYSNTGTVRYYWDVTLRVWGAPPNRLKDQSYQYCYNCVATSIAGVWNGYYGYYTAKHQYVVFNGGIATVDYTSNTGSQSSQSCFDGLSC